ncbi:MAG: toll/interleukin-1 receptor domain-containing protein [Actinomycetota bacterium]|nr:toll/interleukin-1 receptor domain-containing protein [Actinomycetota bacterium]
MPDLPTKRLFVSYSHKDETLAAFVFEHLTGLKHSLQDTVTLEIFIDQNRLSAGDQWRPEIERWLAEADVALLLVSSSFLGSTFIMKEELPRLRARWQAGHMRVIPILLRPCGLEPIGWLTETELRPRGGQALSEIHARDPELMQRILGQLMGEIAGLLGAGTRGATAAARENAPRSDSTALQAPTVHEPSARLLTATLLQELGESEGEVLAHRLVDGIARLTRLTGEKLFHAVRFCVEFQMLVAEEPTSPTTLQQFLREPIVDEAAKRLVSELRPRSPPRDFSQTPIDVNSRFFLLAHDREALWKAYFDAVLEAGVEIVEKEQLRSLPIRVRLGFLAPQYLVAGLLSRFNDDWRPVLNAYQRDPKQRSGPFESLQASQWNTWLVWGPSIPICRCKQWKGVYAFQYGYGDENNSIPVVELEADGEGLPRSLHPVAAGLDAENRGAKFVQLTGRLRWGPWYLRGATDDENIDLRDAELDLAAEDEIGLPGSSRGYPAAPAQGSLFRDDGLMFRHDSDGLTLQVEAVDRVSNERRVYFSAYLWMMFLVALPPEESTVGPKLMHGKSWPEWPDPPERRGLVRAAKLWEDLLPVFVHANIADPAALGFQKRALAQNAVAMLSQVWQRRAELFDAKDVQVGIQFHLVSASDYTGCGCAIRYPSGTSLLDLMRERLVQESDAEFAASVVLPRTAEEGDARPWGLASYFSTCHLPELVSDYFEFVNRRTDKRNGSA